MGTTMSFVADRGFSKTIERVISKTGMYQSKSEFLRDAARQRLIQLLGIEKEVARVNRSFSKLRKKVKFYRPLTLKDKERLAREYFNNFKRNPRE